MALEDRYYPANLGNPPSVTLDGQFFYYVEDGHWYLRNTIGMTIDEAYDYIDALRNDTILRIKNG